MRSGYLLNRFRVRFQSNEKLFLLKGGIKYERLPNFSNRNKLFSLFFTIY